MSLESFRRALRARHREAVACARARLLGEVRDEARLDELDAELFSRDETASAASEWLASAREGASATPVSASASARSRLAITLEEGLLARLRPLDRAIEGALARGRREEAEELGEERRRRLTEEGSRALAQTASGEKRTARALAAATRGESADATAADARTLLSQSEGIAGQAAGFGGKGRRVRDAGLVPGSGARAPLAGLSPVDPVSRIVEAWCGAGPAMPADRIGPALRELGTDLGVEPRSGAALAIAVGRPGAPPAVLEIDPPEEVLLVLPTDGGIDRFAASLDAWGTSLAPRMRSPELPDEHRLHADHALGRALGALMASLVPEHAMMRREPVPARQRALAREIASARLSASLFLEQDRLLSGVSAGSAGARSAIEEASLDRTRQDGPAPPREPVFEAMDRFRGHLLAPHLVERLRTRFGNLWYRERGAGRLLREACEPGGSLLTTEILAGLSLSVPSAESLVDSWRDEIKRLR